MMYWVEGHNSWVLGALPPREIFMFLWIRLSIIHKTHLLSSLFSKFHVKKLGCFHEPQIGRIYPNISLSNSFLRLTNFKRKKLNSSCRIIWVCKPSIPQIHWLKFHFNFIEIFIPRCNLYIYIWSLSFDFSVAQCSIRRSRARCRGR